MKIKIIIFLLANILLNVNLIAQNPPKSTKVLRATPPFKNISGIIYTYDRPVLSTGIKVVPLLVNTNSNQKDLTFSVSGYSAESHFNSELKQYYVCVAPLDQKLTIRRGEWDTTLLLTKDDMFNNPTMAPVWQVIEDDAGSFSITSSINCKSASFSFNGESIEEKYKKYYKPGEYGLAIDISTCTGYSLLKQNTKIITIKPFDDNVLYLDSLIGFLSVIHSPKTNLKDSITFDLSIDDKEIGKAPKQNIALWKNTPYKLKIFNNSIIPFYVKSLTINNSQPYTLFIDKPVIIMSNVENSVVKINGKRIGTTNSYHSDNSYEMSPTFLYSSVKGYEITAEKKDYTPATEMLQVNIDNSSDPIIVNLTLKPDCKLKVKRMKNTSRIIFIPEAAFLFTSALVGIIDCNNYSKYQKSTSVEQATNLHKTILTQDKIFWVSLSLSLLDFYPTVHYNHKYRVYKRDNCQ